MKPSQTVLLLVLVAGIIFGVTFASMYVSRPGKSAPSRKREGAGSGVNPLTFLERRYPPDATILEERPATEYGQQGQHDFWFENPNDETVRVGLARGCECSGVYLFLVPREWHRSLALTAAMLVGQGATAGPPLDQRPILASALRARLNDLAGEATEGTRLETGARRGVDVPARESGFVRLRWDARRGPTPGARFELLKAELWWHDPEAGGATNLEVATVLVDGVRLDVTDVNAGTLGPRDSATRTVYLWSSTRSDLASPEVTSTAEPFVTCSKPEALTEVEKRELHLRVAMPRRPSTVPQAPYTEAERRNVVGPVRSAYRMTVSVREEVDGRRFDEGFFMEHVRIRTRESIVLPTPLEILVRGRVHGDIALAGADNGIVLEPFAVRSGTTREVTLETDRPDIRLKVERVPRFMTVKLSEPRTSGTGRRSWTLTLVIEPNKVSGTFPRRDLEQYRDTAIYLRLEGAVNRRLRLPVTGEAKQ